LLGRLYDSGWR